MDVTPVPDDFSALLRLLNEKSVRYLVIGAYAVAHHGYPRGTVDLDVWVAMDPTNARRVVESLREFGFDVPDLTPGLFLEPRSIVRMGRPPYRIELSTTISGVEFDECYARAASGIVAEVPVRFLSLADLRKNKLASGRPKDLADLDQLPDPDA